MQLGFRKDSINSFALFPQGIGIKMLSKKSLRVLARHYPPEVLKEIYSKANIKILG